MDVTWRERRLQSSSDSAVLLALAKDSVVIWPSDARPGSCSTSSSADRRPCGSLAIVPPVAIRTNRAVRPAATAGAVAPSVRTKRRSARPITSLTRSGVRCAGRGPANRPMSGRRCLAWCRRTASVRHRPPGCGPDLHAIGLVRRARLRSCRSDLRSVR